MVLKHDDRGPQVTGRTDEGGDHPEELLTVSRDVASLLAKARDLRLAMQKLVSVCLNIASIDAAGVYVVDHESRELRLVSHIGLSQAFVASATRFDFESAQAGLVLAGDAVYASYPEVRKSLSATNDTSEELLCLGVVPIVFGESIIGAFNVATRSAATFSRMTRLVVETIATQIGAAMMRLIAEDQRTLLVQELDHRVRNNLSMVEALASQALNRTTTVEHFREKFVGRLRAMVRSHEGVVGERPDGLELQTVLNRALAPVLGAQLSLNGPRVRLAGSAATPVCLVFHELGNNALTHGALSSPDGFVNLSWTITGDHLTLEWQESQGPTLDAEPNLGTGAAIIRALVVHQLGGGLDLQFQSAGLRCTTRIPVSYIETCTT